MDYEIVSDSQGVTIYKGAIIGENVQIGRGSIVYPGVEIRSNTKIGPYCTLVRRDVAQERVVGVPGKDICSVRDSKNDQGENLYPWKDYLKDFRGYPWQVEK